MGCLFPGCTVLEKLPDISEWNINTVNNMNGLFTNCSLLKNFLISQNGI